MRCGEGTPGLDHRGSARGRFVAETVWGGGGCDGGAERGDEYGGGGEDEYGEFSGDDAEERDERDGEESVKPIERSYTANDTVVNTLYVHRSPAHNNVPLPHPRHQHPPSPASPQRNVLESRSQHRRFPLRHHASGYIVCAADASTPSQDSHRGPSCLRRVGDAMIVARGSADDLRFLFLHLLRNWRWGHLCLFLAWEFEFEFESGWGLVAWVRWRFGIDVVYPLVMHDDCMDGHHQLCEGVDTEVHSVAG